MPPATMRGRIDLGETVANATAQIEHDAVLGGNSTKSSAGRLTPRLNVAESGEGATLTIANCRTDVNSMKFFTTGGRANYIPYFIFR